MRKFGLEDRIREFDVSSATVELAAEAVGVIPARICKTLTFKDPDGNCIIIQTAGDTKIQNGKFKRKFGLKAKMLTPDEVKEFTGHEIGGNRRQCDRTDMRRALRNIGRDRVGGCL